MWKLLAVWGPNELLLYFLLVVLPFTGFVCSGVPRPLSLLQGRTGRHASPQALLNYLRIRWGGQGSSEVSGSSQFYFLVSIAVSLMVLCLYTLCVTLSHSSPEPLSNPLRGLSVLLWAQRHRPRAIGRRMKSERVRTGSGCPSAGCHGSGPATL